MKRALRIVLVLAALLVIGGVAFVLSLDRIAAATIRRGGTHALGVETSVESVDLSLGSTIDAKLAGLAVANPEGFEAERFFALGTGSLAFPAKGVFSGTLSVPELALGGIELNLERRDGRTNYGVILDNLAKLGGEAPAEEAPEDDGGGKRLAIERIVLTDIDATIDLLPQAGDAARVSIHLPELVIENLDSDMSTAQLFSLVIRTLLTAVLQNAGNLLPQDLLDDLRGRLGGLGNVAFDLTGGAAQASKEVLSRGEELLKEGAGKLGEEAGEALKGLGGILKKDK